MNIREDFRDEQQNYRRSGARTAIFQGFAFRGRSNRYNCLGDVRLLGSIAEVAEAPLI